MRLSLTILIGLLATAAPAAARGKPASVAVTECAASAVQGERAAAFEGRMRAQRPGQRLQMRFQLRRRAGTDARWTRVHVPEWDVWQTADPGVGRYIYEKRVEGLEAPALYRAVVRFRWTSIVGRVVRTQRVVSAPCRQPDLRPDLRAFALVARDGGYSVQLLNEGGAASGPFAVTLTVNGQRQPAQEVAGLGAGERRREDLAGPGCVPGTQVAVQVDSDGRVRESDEADNQLQVTCPAG